MSVTLGEAPRPSALGPRPSDMVVAVALFEIHIEYADGCVVEFKAPQVVAIDPGHDGWVVGKEAVVLIEFDFEGDTVQRLGMPDGHRH